MVVIIAATSARWKRVRTVGLLSLAVTALAACDAATAPAAPVAAQDQPKPLTQRVPPADPFAQEQRVFQGGGPCGGILYGFVFTSEPLTVHERPDAGSPVLGRVLGADLVRPEVRILDARDGWLRIVDAHDDQGHLDAQGDGAKAREMYSGLGWVRGEGVTVILQTSFAFNAPSHRAAVVLETPGGMWLSDIGNQVAITSCEDGWVLARWDVSPRAPEPHPAQPKRYADFAVVSRDPLIIEGWSTGICNIQETTCDGVDGDVPQKR